MLTKEYLNNLISSCHAAAVAGGWWTDLETGKRKDRNKAEMLCLEHSEVSEAREGLECSWRDETTHMDDKLPHRSMEEVELADVAIRAADYAGGFDMVDLGSVGEELRAIGWEDDEYLTDARDGLLMIHAAISNVMEGVRKGRMSDVLPNRTEEEVWKYITFLRVFEYAEYFGLDVEGAIEEKMNFNASREDHRIENRRAEGGKKF